MSLLYLDLETLPCNNETIITEFYNAAQQEADVLIAAVTAPSNYKDQAKIDEYIVTKKASIQAGVDADVTAKLGKTSFDGMYGRIACIAWAHGDGEIQATSATMSESDAIQCFYDSIAVDGSYIFCGHNIAGFDLPFLKHRSIILGIRPPPDILRAMKAKPWDDCIQDTMNLWDAKKMVGLSRLCKVFGIKDDDDMDGGMVAEMWKTNPERVIQYCKNDVELTRKIYKRIMFL